MCFLQHVRGHTNISTAMRYAHSKKDAQREKINSALAPKLRQTKHVKRQKFFYKLLI